MTATKEDLHRLNPPPKADGALSLLTTLCGRWSLSEADAHWSPRFHGVDFQQAATGGDHATRHPVSYLVRRSFLDIGSRRSGRGAAQDQTRGLPRLEFHGRARQSRAVVARGDA